MKKFILYSLMLLLFTQANAQENAQLLHYLSLYPKELQELRGRFKPGLVPPYYVDLPRSFDEIMESERRYLNKKQAHPIKTDIEYFFKAGVNIVFRRARSN